VFGESACTAGRKNTRKTSMPSDRGKNRDLAAERDIALVHRVAEFFLCWFFCFAVFVFAFSHLSSDSSGFGVGRWASRNVSWSSPASRIASWAMLRRATAISRVLAPAFPRPDRIRSCGVAVRRLLKAPSRVRAFSAPRSAVVMMSPEMSLNSVTRLLLRHQDDVIEQEDARPHLFDGGLRNGFKRAEQ
jgi:hypothetical protein